MSSSYVEMMLDSLRKKVDVLEEIIKVNNSQKEFLSQEKFEPEVLDEIVAKKEKLVEEINKLDGGFETVYERMKGQLEDNKTEFEQQIAEMKTYIRRIVELTASIETEEKRMKVMIDNQFSKVRQAVKETKKNSKAVSNYYKNMAKFDMEPQFMDKKK